MHELKVVFLVAATLAVMRAVSWALAWLLERLVGRQRRAAVAVAANAGGLLLFLAFLRWDRLPGEQLDTSAAAFGAAVYALFAVVDLARARRRRD
jgi:drug/metabolite transporter (DMT)-like permease